MPESPFLIKFCNFIKKETLEQVFSFEFCEMSQNKFFYRTSPVAATVYMYYYLDTSKLKPDVNPFNDPLHDIVINISQ